MESQNFRIIREKGHIRLVVLADRLDALLAPKLRSELVVLAGSGEGRIVLDLNDLQYCDSSGLSAILVANRLCREASDGIFILTGLSKEVERLITISQLDTVLKIAYTDAQVDQFLAENAKS